MARDRAVEQASAKFFKRLEAEEARNPRSSHVLRGGTGVHGGFERYLRGLPVVRVLVTTSQCAVRAFIFFWVL